MRGCSDSLPMDVSKPFENAWTSFILGSPLAQPYLILTEILNPFIILSVSYLFAAFLFILSLDGLAGEQKAKRGLWYGVSGMIIAVLATYIASPYSNLLSWIVIPLAIAPGAVAGGICAHTIRMTQMPQLVAVLNSFGGLASALEQYAVYLDQESEFIQTYIPNLGETSLSDLSSYDGWKWWITSNAFISLGLFVGFVCFSGSIVAMLKLNGWVRSAPLKLPGLQIGNFLCILICIALTLVQIYLPQPWGIIPLFLVNLIAIYVGIIFVMAIGGADMPVVVSILNSVSGWSGTAAGFSLGNPLLIVTGTLVGASGAILSIIMCQAMHRSLVNVLFGTWSSKGAAKKVEGTATEIKSQDVADMLLKAHKVVIAPGYGLAVARAQHAVSQLAALLRQRGVEVIFAIHPVAGRLPGHMNVLLAEASVPYDIVKGMDDVNRDMDAVDVSIVIGANDIVNLAAIEDPGSSIAGMPIIEVHRSKACIVMKRSMKAGYAGVDNPLFVKNNTRMLFGDAKTSLENLVGDLKELINTNGYNGNKNNLHPNPLHPPQAHRPTSTVTPQTAELDEVLCDDGDEQLTIPGTEHHSVFPPDDSLQDASTLNNPEAIPPAPGSRPSPIVGFVKEYQIPHEHRVAITPSGVKQLRKYGFYVCMEAAAGVQAGFPDRLYVQAGCHIFESSADVFERASIIVKINTIVEEEIPMLRNGQVLVAFLQAARNPELLQRLAQQKCTAISMDLVPRTTVAQKFDALSSSSNIAGYRAVVEAQTRFGRFFMGQITAAGSIPAAKVLVIGAGVAGLAAISLAHSMGAIVTAFDTRPEVKEQVESVGGAFLTVPTSVDEDEDGHGGGGYGKVMSEAYVAREKELFLEQCKQVDIVITTAAIPGKKAPLLIEKYMVDAMKPGSVVVDLATETGGNCEVSSPGAVVSYNDVTIVGYMNFPARMPGQSSELYAMNICNLMVEMGGATKFSVESSQSLTVAAMTAVRQGEITFGTSAPVSLVHPPANKPLVIRAVVEEKNHRDRIFLTVYLLASLLFVALILFTPAVLAPFLLIFSLSIYLGWALVNNVAPSLFTPLMSNTNAISGIVILGGMFQANLVRPSLFFALPAITVSAINIVGGFAVTLRILKMYKHSSG